MDGFCSINDISSDADEFTFNCSYESTQDRLGQGFQHGVSDAYLDNANMSMFDFVNKPDNALHNQTQSFSDGYAKGWCSVMGPNHAKQISNAEFECETVLKPLHQGKSLQH